MSDNVAQLYWAAEPDVKKLGPRAMERLQQHLGLLSRSGRLGKMRTMLSAYYGLGTDGMRSTNELRNAGEDGEVTEMSTNQVRPVIANAMSLIAGQPLTTKAKAKNSDSETLAQTRLADALLDAYETLGSSNERENDTIRGGLIASSWVLGQAWSPKDGKEWARDESGLPIYDGAPVDFVLPPWRCVFDFAATDEGQRKWALFRRPVSRWDTAAQFDATDPVLAAKLRKQTSSGSAGPVPDAYAQGLQQTAASLDWLLGEKLPEEDVLWVWELRHLPTPALPQGRLLRFAEPDLVLWDSFTAGAEYPYEKDDLHLYEFSPERAVAGGQGHTAAFDLGALQEFVDICTASIATTVNVNGQMHLWSPDEGGPLVRAMGEGNTVLISPTKPEPIEFPALKPEVLQAAEWAISQGRQAMALNDVVMGQPDKGMPAQAQALQRAQAQQFHAVAQAERVRLRRRAVNGRLKMLKRFAKTPRMTRLVGKDRAYEMKEWQRDDISAADFVDVEIVDPMLASYEGRMGVLEQLGQQGTFKDQPDAMLTFIQTGRLDAVTTTARQKRELVEANVALLQKGIGPPQVDIQASMQAGSPQFVEPAPGTECLRILKSDPHHLAVPAYLGVLTSPGSRADKAIMQAALEAIQLSMELWGQLTPDEAAVFDIPPLPSQLAAAADGPPMGPGGPPPPGGPKGPPPDAPKDAQGVKLPAPPPNPLSGSKESASSTGLTPK